MSELINCINNLSAKDILRAATKTANGVPFYINALGLSALCPAYQTVYDYFTNKPSDADKAIQNTMVCDLVDAGLWAKGDVFAVCAGHSNTARESYVNWITPGTYNGTPITDDGAHDPTWVQYQGFIGVAITSAGINTNYIPSTHTNNYTLNSGSIFTYVRNDLNGNFYTMGVNQATFDGWIVPRNANQFSGRLNDNGSLFIATANGSGLWVLSRTAANVRTAYRNGGAIGNDAQVSVSLPTAAYYMLCRNNVPAGGNFYEGELSFYGIFAGLDNTEQGNLSTILNNYMTAYGKNVY